MVSLCLATLATNIAANVVSPANDFAHLWPRRISFRTGGLITGVLGILMQPWKLIADPVGLHLHVAGRLFRAAGRGRRHPDRRLLRHPPHAARPGGLYQSAGRTGTAGGFNPAALSRWSLGIAPCVPGFLGTIGVLEVAPVWISMYHYAWFISFGLSAVCYLVLMKLLAMAASRRE